MRFMMLMIPKVYAAAAPGTRPDPKHVAAMMKTFSPSHGRRKAQSVRTLRAKTWIPAPSPPLSDADLSSIPFRTAVRLEG